MKFPEPDIDLISIDTIINAISEPLRLEIIRQLHARGEATCSSLDMPIKVQTVSHHMNILREAGMISTRLEGTARPSTLRKKELDQRFPGFMDAILTPQS